MKNIKTFEEFSNIILESSDITPERMLLSVYNKIKTMKGIKIGKINKNESTFDFEINLNSDKYQLANVLKGQIEARSGKIMISFDKITINPTQYEIVYDDEITLTKDHTRTKANQIILRYMNKFRKNY